MAIKLEKVSSTIYFVRMRALTWQMQGPGSIHIIALETWNAFLKAVQGLPQDTTILADFGGINGLLDDIKEDICISQQTVAMANLNQASYRVIDSISKKKPRETKGSEPRQTIVVGKELAELTENKLKAIAKNVRIHEDSKIKDAVKGAWIEFSSQPQNYHSRYSPLYKTGGHFDARRIISDRAAFMTIALRMTELCERIIEEQQLPSPCLLAVSLRASPFALAIKILAEPTLNLLVVDHLGPKEDLIEEYSLRGDGAPRDFIHVSDFIIRGSELNTSKTHTRHSGSKCEWALSIGAHEKVSDDKDKDYYWQECRINVLRLVDLRVTIGELT